MTVKDFFRLFSIARNQRVHITDNTLKQTYDSNTGDFCFENSAHLFGGDYEKTIRHILRLKVIRFEIVEHVVWIHAE